MKLLYCKECHDVIALIPQESRACLCKKSRGEYLNQQSVLVTGPCEVLGFHNKSFEQALKHKDPTWGTKFEAFVIPNNARTVERV